MKPRVYVETTIPSFYYEQRPEASMVARRDWTREWWDAYRMNYDPVSSIAVIEELQEGEHPAKHDALALLASLELLVINDTIIEIVDTYIEHRIMPRDPRGDALHLAIASYHRCQFLLTWNCAHLANANKIEHIRHINNMLGLYVPALVTPMELSEEEV